MPLVGKMLIAQGGGPTAVINESLVGIIKEARRNPNVTHIYGALNGIQGIYEERFVDLAYETEENIECIAKTPGSILLSTRVKPDGDYLMRMFEVMRHHDVRYFLYIGGNDSADTVRIIKEYADKEDYDLVAIHIPKTIDNDLRENDHSPGFGSAARYVIQAFRGVEKDNMALGGIYIGIIMGRHAGYLTAAAALAQQSEDEGPHLVYVPEIPFDLTSFLDDVEQVYNKFGRCTIAVSEGIEDAEGNPIITHLMKTASDSHGNIQLSGNGLLGDMLAEAVKDRLNITRVRADTFGYLQRSFLGVRSDTDAKEAREVGEVGAKQAFKGLSGSIVIRRVPPYRVYYELVPVEMVARESKVMPREFMNEAGNFVSDAFVEYARPLIGNNIPEIAVLRSPPIAKTFYKDED